MRGHIAQIGLQTNMSIKLYIDVLVLFMYSDLGKREAHLNIFHTTKCCKN